MIQYKLYSSFPSFSTHVFFVFQEPFKDTTVFTYLFLLIWEKQNIILSFYLFTHSLVDFCMFPDLGWNLQSWCMGTMLQPTVLPYQGQDTTLFSHVSVLSFNMRRYLLWPWHFWRVLFLHYTVTTFSQHILLIRIESLRLTHTKGERN